MSGTVTMPQRAVWDKLLGRIICPQVIDLCCSGSVIRQAVYAHRDFGFAAAGRCIAEQDIIKPYRSCCKAAPELYFVLSLIHI